MGSHVRYTGTRRNQIRAAAFLVQTVRQSRVFAFDFAALVPASLGAPPPPPPPRAPGTLAQYRNPYSNTLGQYRTVPGSL
eukprot:1996771-Rhodomonas_salina.1